MKKFLLPFLSLSLGSLLLASCSSDIEKGLDSSDFEKVSKGFLSISLVSPHAVTRADYDEDDYEYGTESENKVNSIRFYFFDAKGVPSPVRKQTASDNYLSYIDWTPSENDQTTGDPDGTTVEKIVKATIGINQPYGTEHPKLVLAVINPPEAVKNYSGELTLNNLKNIVSDYYKGLHDDNFVITNSVYVDSDKNIISATPISEDNLKPSADDPDLKTLVIYVERVLARIDLQLNLENTVKTIRPSDGSPEYQIYQVSQQEVNGDEKDIYMKLLGWNVSRYTITSRLVKDINKWPTDLFGVQEPWNISEYHRCFWAINPENVSYVYNTFEPVPGSNYPYASQLPIPANGSKASPIYTQENAADYKLATDGTGATKPTSLVFAAQLVDENGDPLSLVRYANKYYTETGVLNQIANNLNLWSRTEQIQPDEDQKEWNGYLYTHITPSDLKFISAEDLYGDKLPDDVAEYFVYVELSNQAKDVDWYERDSNTGAFTLKENVNDFITATVDYLLVWNEGDAYYFIDIRHLGEKKDKPGYWGIVRNHIYNINLKKIEGLGTPVFNPDQVFDPQHPVTDDNVISAEVRILQWRVVSQDYEISF